MTWDWLRRLSFQALLPVSILSNRNLLRKDPEMKLSLLANLFVVCQLDAHAQLPMETPQGEFWSVTRTREELSFVCSAEHAPAGARREGDWRCLKVEGPLDFSLVGIMAELAGRLAAAGVSVFVISTFDTDYLLVKEARLAEALNALRSAGHSVD